MGIAQNKQAEEKPHQPCLGTVHQQATFNCQGINCGLSPVICKNCAHQSTEQASLFMCKLCKVTERMKNFDVDALEIDTSNSIKLIASVSFDKQKRQFKYS